MKVQHLPSAALTLVNSNPTLDCNTHYRRPPVGGVGRGREMDEVARLTRGPNGARRERQSHGSQGDEGDGPAVAGPLRLRGDQRADPRSHRRASAGKRARSARAPGPRTTRTRIKRARGSPLGLAIHLVGLPSPWHARGYVGDR